MEATGSDGGRGPSLPWTYRKNQIGSSNSDGNSISSSSSGTIVSTTCTSRGSRLSSISMDAVRHFELALDEDTELGHPTKKSRKEREEHMDIKSLVWEFFGAPSAELSIKINSNNSGDMSVLERWFSELGVAWVLHLPDADADANDASAQLYHPSAAAAQSWIRGLDRIFETIRSTSAVLLGLPSVCEQEGQPVPETESDKEDNDVLDQLHLARFAKKALSKMLAFVGFAIRQVVVRTNGMPALPVPYKKLHSLLGVYEALSDATFKIQVLFCYNPLEVYRIQSQMVSLFSAKKKEACEAIWSTMERIRTLVLDDSSSSVIPQASSDIHKVTLSAMEHITFLCSNSSSMCQTVSEAVEQKRSLHAFIMDWMEYVPEYRQEQPIFDEQQEQPMDRIVSIVMGMKSCLQEKLVKMSDSFSDQGLKFLFLLNNFGFIQQSLVDNHFWYGLLYHEKGDGMSEEAEAYLENYLQACWEPVLSCLFSPTPLCLGINHSPLLKFESEFKKTYATQKLWKVPDPKIRKRLCTAITKKIVPRYTEYIEENNIMTPGVVPQDLEMMLQELFEG